MLKFRDTYVSPYNNRLRGYTQLPRRTTTTSDPEQKSNLKRFIIGSTLSILAVGVATKFASPAVGKVVRNMATRGTGKLARSASSALGANALKGRFTDIFRLSSGFRKMEGRAALATAAPIKALEAFRKTTKAAGTGRIRNLYNFWSPEQIGGYSRAQRAGGYFYKRTIENAATLPIYYGVDRVANLRGGKQPKWYDVKGNLKDFAQYAAFDVAYSYLPGAVGASTAILGRKGLNTISKITGSDTGKYVFEKALKTASKSRKYYGSFTNALKNTLHNINKRPERVLPIRRTNNRFKRYNYGPHIKGYGSKLKSMKDYFQGEYRSTFQNINSRSYIHNSGTVFGSSHLQEFLKATDKITPQSSTPSEVKEYVGGLLKTFEKGPKTFREKLLGIERNTLAKSQVKEIKNVLQNTGFDNDEIRHYITQGLYQQEGIFKHRGKIYDLQNLDKNHVAKYLDNKLKDSRFKFFGNMLGVNRFLNKRIKTPFETFIPDTAGKQYISPHLGNLGTGVKVDRDIITQNGTRRYIRRATAIRRDESLWYIARGLVDNGEDEAVSKLIKYDSQSKYIYEAGHSRGKRTMSDLYKYAKGEFRNEEKISSETLLHRTAVSFKNSIVGKFFTSKKKSFSSILDTIASGDEITDSMDVLRENFFHFKKIYGNMVDQSISSLDHPGVKKAYQQLLTDNNVDKAKDIFNLNNNDLVEFSQEIINKNKDLAYVTKWQNHINQLSESAKFSPAKDLGEYLGEAPSKRKILELFAIGGQLKDLNISTSQIVDKLPKTTGLVDEMFIGGLDTLTGIKKIDPISPNQIDDLKDFYLKAKSQKSRWREFAEYYRTERNFAGKIKQAITIDDPMQVIYGGDLPFRFISSKSNGVAEIAGSYFNMFKGALTKYDPNKPSIKKLPIMSNAYSWWSEKTSTMKHLAGLVGVGPSKLEITPDIAHTNMEWVGRRVKQMTALAVGYTVADALVDELGIFDNTALDEGLSVYAGEKVAQAKVLGATIRDTLGITQGAQYLEGLMPGSSTLLPAMALGTIGGMSGGITAPITAALISGALGQSARSVGLVTPYKSAQDLKDEYSGKKLVGRKRHRWWTLSMEPFAGSGVDYYMPSWLSRLRAQYDYTPSGKGSKMQSLLTRPLPIINWNPISSIIGGKYSAERQHYFTRPGVYSSTPFSDIPFVGPPSSVIGRALKPRQMMHQNILRTAQETNPPPINPSIPGSSGALLTSTYYQTMVKMIGFSGYKIQQIGGRYPLSPDLTYEEAGREYLMSQKYHQASFGDIALSGTELGRRFIPDEKSTLQYNPIPNMIGAHLPEEFTSGNPYARVEYADARLPGYGYETLHNVSHEFPVGSSTLGYSIPEYVKKMIGLKPIDDEELYESSVLGKTIHHQIQSRFQLENRLVASEEMVYDAANDVVGFVDAILRGENGEETVTEIKTFSEDNPPNAPRSKHIHQLNFYLAMLGKQEGELLYLPRGLQDYMSDSTMKHARRFNVKLDLQMLERDMKILKLARMKAKKAIENKIGLRTGSSYGWLDRFKILSDVSPTSDAYRRAEILVQTQMKFGKLSQDEIKEYNYYKQLRNKRLRRYDVYPYRFSGQSFMTDTPGIKLVEPDSGDDTYLAKNLRHSEMKFINYYNDNPEMRPSYDYSLPERMIGRAWELGSHSKTIWHRKFLNQYTPRQLYEMQHIYGDDFRPWNEPIQSWVKPHMREMVSGNVIQGMYKGAAAGTVAYGPAGGMIGAAVGLGSNLTNKMVESIKGNPYIPQNVTFRNELNEYMDQMEYWKSQYELQTTGDPQAYTRMHETMIGAETRSQLFKAMPTPEKSYLGDFIDEKDPIEQRKIYQIAPRYLKPILAREWGLPRDKIEAYTPTMPNADWSGWDESVPTDDIKASLVRNEGYNLHDFGVGYGYDKIKMSDDYLADLAIKDEPPVDTKLNENVIIDYVKKLVGGAGRVSVSGRDSNMIEVILT